MAAENVVHHGILKMSAGVVEGLLESGRVVLCQVGELLADKPASVDPFNCAIPTHCAEVDRSNTMRTLW